MRNKILRIFRTVLSILIFLIVSAPMTHCQQYIQYIDIRMSFQISPLLILSAISLVGGTCQRSDQTPEVKVMNSSHVYISWEAPFQGCERERIQSAHVFIGNPDGDITDIEVDFSVSGIVVKANPCLSLSIRRVGCPKNIKRGAGGQNVKKENVETESLFLQFTIAYI